MRLDSLPVVGAVRDAGPDDRVFDGLLLAGPVVVAAIALAGPTTATRGLAAGYLLSLVGYVLYRAVSGARSERPGMN